MEQLFPGLELGGSTRWALDDALDDASGLEIRPLPTEELDEFVAVCREEGARVAVPADANETRAVVQATTIAPGDFGGPLYIRVDDRPAPVVYPVPPSFAFGRAVRLRDGDDVTIMATGLLVAAALVAHERLAEMSVGARVLNMASLRPLDEEAVAAAARETGALVTAEEARVQGGLGSAVARVVTVRHPVPMEHLGLDEGAGGGPETLLRRGLTAAHVMGAVHDVLERA